MIVNVCAVPEQLTDPFVKVGVMVIVPEMGEVPLLVAVKDGIPVTLPTLAAASPMLVLSFAQV